MIYRLGHRNMKELSISNGCSIKSAHFWETVFDLKFIYVKIPSYNIASSSVAWLTLLYLTLFDLTLLD
jgi:hypothetical protein